MSAPEPPFWCAAAIAPYGAKRATPVAIDYLTSRATANERAEVTVCENVRGELERARLDAPVLIDATEAAEVVFRRGEEALAVVGDALYLTSTRGALPTHGTVAIAAWPLDLARLGELFAEATDYGVVIPVIYPITTDLDALNELAGLARGAKFFAAMPVDVDATAKQAIANELQLKGGDDRYEMLFHADVAPIQLATERHIAALAAARGLHDFVTPPRWEERSNWNAAVLLTRTASRMIAIDLDLDLAGVMARSARAIAELDKPLTRIAEAASLSIIEALDETSAEMLTEWLRGGEAGFAQYVDEQWRLSRQAV